MTLYLKYDNIISETNNNTKTEVEKMLITVQMELSFEDLERECWSGAINTLKTIREHDMEDAFMDFLFEVFCDGDYPTLTAINDLLWFEDGFIFESLGIDPDDDDDYEDEEDEDEDEDDYDDDFDYDFDEKENAMLLRGDDEYVDRVAEEIMNR